MFKVIKAEIHADSQKKSVNLNISDIIYVLVSVDLILVIMPQKG